MALIEVQQLVKEFRSPKRQPGLGGSIRTLFTREENVVRAVDDVSFQLEEGELLGYIGPNGAGKSTTIKMLTGILVPSSGSIHVAGLALFSPMLAWFLRNAVREGSVATDLARPIPYLGQLLANQVGFSTGQILFLIIAAPFALVLGGMLPPASLSAGLFYLVSLVLAYAIATLIGLLIGLASFWTTETGGVQSIYDFISSFFAGALVPLWFFPPVLRMIGSWLPFEAQGFVPMQIYHGQISGAAILPAS